MNDSQPVDTLGIMVYTCAAQEPFAGSLETACFPVLLVLNGPVRVDSAMDTFLTTVLHLDVRHECYGHNRVKLWLRSEPI
jgi:hypothetical protein